VHETFGPAVWWPSTVTLQPLGASVKKGRHRRFEEARKLKQSGPDFLFSSEPGRSDDDADEVEDDDEYAALARKYGAFDEEEVDEEA
jgi:hypothetical protein